MITVLSALVSILSFRLRSRASLELELIALRHQVAVLRRQRHGRPRLLCSDRLLWVWLYRIWPQALHVMVLVKPATVIQWHRKGFRLYWRWRSRSGQPGRPKTPSEVRTLEETPLFGVGWPGYGNSAGPNMVGTRFLTFNADTAIAGEVPTPKGMPT
jgi:putative transposase